MNVYEMFGEVGMTLPFWIRRDTWGDTIAKVTGIEGAEVGKPLRGRPPYYGNPPVYADFYKIESGEKVGENQPVSCPGTYSYMLCDDKGGPMFDYIRLRVLTASLPSIDRRCEELGLGADNYFRMLVKQDIGVDILKPEAPDETK